MNDFLTYDAKLYATLQDMIRKARLLVGEDKMEAAFELVHRFDPTLKDTTHIILQKDWRQLENKNTKGILYGNEYNIEGRKIANRFLDMLEQVEKKYAPAPGTYAITVTYPPGTDLKAWIGDARPLKILEWLRAFPKTIRSLCRLTKPGERQHLTGGLLWKDNLLFTSASLADSVAQTDVSLLGDERYASRNFRLQPAPHQANTSLGYAILQLQAGEKIAFPNLHAGRLKTGETGWFVSPKAGKEPTAAVQIAACLGVQDGWYGFHSENLSLTSGTVVLNRQQQLVGLYLGHQEAGGRYKILSIYEILEALEAAATPAPEPAPVATSTTPTTTLNPHHQYSCNRMLQKDDFAITALTYPEEDQQRVHFFLLYGCDLQQNEGLFRWFAARLAGKHNDHLRQAQTNYIRVTKRVLSFPPNKKLAALKLAMVSDFLSIFNIPPGKIERLKQKNLAFALEHSRQLKTLKAEDRIAVLFIISERSWDPRVFQPAIQWFIRDFCQVNLPAQAPQFFFFFGVEYDEDRSDIPQQIQAVVANQEIPLNPLAELAMVTKDDVEHWFETYRMFWRRTRDRKRTFKKYFQQPFAEEGELYMEDVQDFLEQIINEINESEKDANRHS